MRGKMWDIMQSKVNCIGIFWSISDVVNIINVASRFKVNKDQSNAAKSFDS